METSTAYSEDLRSMFASFGKIAIAIAFVVLICAFAIGSVQAAEHGGGGHGGGEHRGGGDGDHRGGSYRGGGGHWGGGYYAPGPDIYVAPEPYVYAPAPCYGPDYEGGDYDGPEYYCNPPPPPGINLFFGL
jgi:hypothetical protein